MNLFTILQGNQAALWKAGQGNLKSAGWFPAEWSTLNNSRIRDQAPKALFSKLTPSMPPGPGSQCLFVNFPGPAQSIVWPDGRNENRDPAPEE